VFKGIAATQGTEDNAMRSRGKSFSANGNKTSSDTKDYREAIQLFQTSLQESAKADKILVDQMAVCLSNDKKNASDELKSWFK
jgi:hypothetical protein